MGDPSAEYSIDAETFRREIEWWLTPVINTLNENSSSYANAYTTTGQAASTPGWVGGYGNGDVLSASQSFLSQVSAAIEFLRIDHGQVIDSLNTYKDMSLKHIAWAERTDADHAQNFTNIANNMGGR